MRSRSAVLASALATAVTISAGPALAAAAGPAPAPGARLAFHEEAGRAVGRVTDQLRELAGKLDEHLAQAPHLGGPRGPGGPAERPLISLMLEHRQALGLSADQVTRLEGLREEFGREAIRRDADIRIAELDLQAILHKEPVDLARAETKIREAAQLRADLRLARLKVLEQGKAVLTAEQRTRLEGLAGPPAAGPGGRRAGPPGWLGAPGRRL